MYFQVISKLGKTIRVSFARWDLIIHTKHQEIKGKEHEIQQAVQEPDEIRQSQSDRQCTCITGVMENTRWLWWQSIRTETGSSLPRISPTGLRKGIGCIGGNHEQDKSFF